LSYVRVLIQNIITSQYEVISVKSVRTSQYASSKNGSFTDKPIIMISRWIDSIATKGSDS